MSAVVDGDPFRVIHGIAPKPGKRAEGGLGCSRMALGLNGMGAAIAGSSPRRHEGGPWLRRGDRQSAVPSCGIPFRPRPGQFFGKNGQCGQSSQCGQRSLPPGTATIQRQMWKSIDATPWSCSNSQNAANTIAGRIQPLITKNQSLGGRPSRAPCLACHWRALASGLIFLSLHHAEKAAGSVTILRISSPRALAGHPCCSAASSHPW